MSRLTLARQTQIIAGLVEGNSIRSLSRMTDTHPDTIMRLGVRVGEGCARIMDERLRNLSCQRLQADELWGFVAKKQKQVTSLDNLNTVGDMWTFVALDPDTKLVPGFLVGKRTRHNTHLFIHDLAMRVPNRVQLSTDALTMYAEAVEEAWGANVDYAQVVKFYDADPVGPGRYSPPRVVAVEKTRISGGPDPDHVSTSLVERQNLTMRMSVRRLTRLTNAFSKKLDNFKAAVALHFCHYNFCRLHKTTRVTPAVAAGVENRIWSIAELVEQTAWTGSPRQLRGDKGHWTEANEN